MKIHIITLLLCLPSLLFAQYGGGEGDGFTARLVIQLDLTGVPAGVRPLFAGGRGDGADRFTISTTLSGAELAQLFRGGSGDGHDNFTVNLTLDGTELSPLYGGGNGDGFDQKTISTALEGTTFTALFSGGSGDGFDQGAAAGALDGQSLAGLFAGGPGDGFDRVTITGTLSGAMLDLYGGGPGDGFDEATGSFSLTGTDLAILFGGGGGDGFDTETFFGVLPLPLTLISFDAFPEDKYVLLRWVTEDEVATDFFTIEKTRNGSDFAFVGTTEAAGDSEPGERLHYDMKDEQPYDGTSFYRLQTTDFDGAISLSHLVEVNFTNAEGWDFQFFPNPNTGRQVNFRPVGLEDGSALQLEILDVQGRALLRDELTTDGSDHRFDLTTPLPSGSYLIRVTDGQGQGKAKILIVQ